MYFLGQELDICFYQFTNFLLTMKTLHCKDVGFDCPGIIQADSEAEVLQLAAQHALEAHQTTVTPEMAEQIKPLIHEE